MRRLAFPFAVPACWLPLVVSLHARGDDTTAQLAALVKDGALRVEIALDDGRVPVASGFALQTTGRPVLALDAVARGGKVTAFCANVPQGALILRGSGLRPDIRIDELAIAEDGSIATARWRGEGFWSRLVLGLFGGLARKELGKLRFQTGVSDLVRGELLAPDETKPSAPEKSPSAEKSKPPAAPTTAPPAPSRAEAFLRLVDEVRLSGSEITAFGPRPLSFGEALTLTTSEKEPLRLSIREALFRPEAATGIPAWRVDGTLDGGFGAGTIRWDADRLDFVSGDLGNGRFLVESGFAEKSEIGADRLALELTSGRFRLAGIDVTLAAPSRFAARKFETSKGNLRALVDLDLTGRTGEIRRQGSRLALADAHVRTTGLSIAKGRADGDVSVDFDYRLVYPFVVQYPVAEIEPRRVPLEFKGPFEARLHLASVGAGGNDAVTGTYRFSVNWPPIEKAAFEALRARWVQQITGLEKVSFEIEPEHFAPCGDDCFLASFKITAAKVGSRRL
ncbi:MAG TPA: hypothetical protein VGR00_06625, partial [Thermoanaerobaculia bacterium]|nr:hypothetical protein [Thermoanaerobaculia bacterium]